MKVIVIDPTRCAGPPAPDPVGEGTAAEADGFADAREEGDPITLAAGDEQAAPSSAIAIESDVVVRGDRLRPRGSFLDLSFEFLDPGRGALDLGLQLGRRLARLGSAGGRARGGREVGLDLLLAKSELFRLSGERLVEFPFLGLGVE